MSSPPNPLSLTARVAFSQTDAAGIMHFSTYFFFMEMAEAALFRALGHPLLEDSGSKASGFPRLDCSCRFRLPVSFDEIVETRLTLEEIERGRLHYRFLFLNEAGRRCATGSMTTAYATRTSGGGLQAEAMPVDLYNRLTQWKNLASGET